MIRETGYFVPASMETCHKLEIIVTPKAHIFEDHAVDSMQDLNGLGDKTKYFIEFSHQGSAYKDRHTHSIRYYNQAYKYQHE